MQVPGGYEIEVLEHGATGSVAAEVKAFWSAETAISEEQADARLGSVVCVLRDPAGAIAASSSAVGADIPALGRRMWVLRCLAPTAEARASVEPIAAAVRERLAGLPDAEGQTPIGVCFPLSDPALTSELADAFWHESRYFFGGWSPAGEQLRISYFDDDGRTHTQDMYELKRDHELHTRDSSPVKEETIAAAWVSEAGLDPREAERRLGEIHMVGTGNGEFAGVSTAYLAWNERLRMEMWFVRAFVRPPHRASNLASHLLWQTRDRLNDEYAGGAGTGAPGIVLEVENPGIERIYPHPVWPVGNFAYFGKTPNGAVCRVFWFRGAKIAPLATQGY